MSPVQAIQAAHALRAAQQHEEARALLVAMATQHPSAATLQYETACVHDFLGLEAAAVPYYVAALAGALPDQDRRGAYLGLGSTYRTLGRYEDAERTLSEGLRHFPEAAEIKVFLAMTHYNLGRSKHAVESLLILLAQTSSDVEIQAYARAIALYAEDVERVWPQT